AWDRTLAARLRQPAAGALLLVLIDVDHFKVINQLHGQSHGDQVLCHVAARLRRRADRRSLVARLGGDEFGLLLPLPAFGPGDSPAEISVKAGEIAESWRLAAGGHNVGPVAEFSVSAGFALWLAAQGPPPASSALYDAASRALQQAKAQGRSRTCPPTGS
ncbi:MAG: GGDEF domain-containing protein, partial [Pirellulaceae bacterium]|nr:GGDEF domain-containing protein [Pirellulaceae bacterium]